MDVKHFIACAETVRILPREPMRWLLHDVRYTHVVTPEEGFPFFIDKTCLFYDVAGTYRFIVNVVWENAAGQRRELRRHTSRSLEFSPLQFANDYVFALYNIRVPGPGGLLFSLTTVDAPEIIIAWDHLEVVE